MSGAIPLNRITRWNFGGGAYVISPSSDTHPLGIPEAYYFEHILRAKWSARERTEQEGGGNIDWRGKEGDVLTFWGAGSRCLGQALGVESTPAGPPGLVWSVFSHSAIRTSVARTSGTHQDYLLGGLWHNGIAVQYDGSELFSYDTRPRGACLTQLSGNWYLHYVLHESGRYNVYRAEFDRASHTVTRPPAVIATKPSGGSRSSRPFFFNASGTKGIGIGSQLEDAEYAARKWTIHITGTGGAIEVGDPVSESVIDETYDRSGSLSGGVTLTKTRRVVYNEWIGADFNGDREINITLQKTYNRNSTTACNGVAGADDNAPQNSHGETALGSHTATETQDAVLSWDGPYPGSIQLKHLNTDQSVSDIAWVFDATAGYSGEFYNSVEFFDATPYVFGEAGFDVTRIERRQIISLDVRYGVVLYRKTKTDYSYTTWVDYVTVGSLPVHRLHSAFNYTPALSTVLKTYGSERKRIAWNGETINHVGGTGTYAIALPNNLPLTSESYTTHDTHRHDQTGFSTLNISYWQGTVQASPDYVIISHPLQWAGIGDDETIFNALYRAGEGLELSDPQMQAAVGIEGDNEGYAPIRIHSAPRQNKS